MSRTIPQTDGAMPKIVCCYCLFINFWMTSAVSFLHYSVLIRLPLSSCQFEILTKIALLETWHLCSDLYSEEMVKWYKLLSTSKKANYYKHAVQHGTEVQIVIWSNVVHDLVPFSQ